jgi:hypothetical protein
MKFIIGVLVLGAACSLAAFPKNGADSPRQDGDRPFTETETIDLKLLQSQLNIALGDALRNLGVELVYDERIAHAADAMLRHPEYKDSTDENGYAIPFEEILVKKEGYPCTFVMNSSVSSKTVCPTIRNFDDSDTYAAVASRYVAQMMADNADLIKRSGFTGYGVGVMLADEYPQTEDVVHTDEPKDQWIHVLFFIVQ